MATISDRKRQLRSDSGKWRLWERDFFLMDYIIEEWFLRLDYLQYLMELFNARKLAELLSRAKTEDERAHLRKLYPTKITIKAALQWVLRMKSYGLVNYHNPVKDEPGRVWATNDKGKGNKKIPGGLTIFDHADYSEWVPLEKKLPHYDDCTRVRLHLEQRATLPAGSVKKLPPISGWETDRYLRHVAGVKVNDRADKIPDGNMYVSFMHEGRLINRRYAIQVELTVKERGRMTEILDFFEHLKAQDGKDYYHEIWYYVATQEVWDFLETLVTNRKKFKLVKLAAIQLYEPADPLVG